MSGLRDTFYLRSGKRVFDLCVSACALVLFSPLMALIALLVKLDSRGPVFYRQERIGRGGKPFQLVKFRSMVPGAEHKGAGMLVERNDPRVTALGKFIRKASLDELPQLFNILVGEMSVVGPRPGLRYQVEQYDPEQRRRLLIRPGVTGWAQVNGRNSINWERRIQLDLEYLEKVSLGMDVLIMLKTIPSVLSSQDMIADADYWKEKARRGRAAEQSNGASRDAG